MMLEELVDPPVLLAKKAIVAALLADVELLGIGKRGLQITRAHPGAKLENEAVWTADGKEVNDFAGAGNDRDHQVEIEVIVWAKPKNATAVQAEDRAWALFAQVSGALLRADVTSGSMAPFMKPDGITNAQDKSFVDAAGGYACEVVMKVAGLIRTRTT